MDYASADKMLELIEKQRRLDRQATKDTIEDVLALGTATVTTFAHMKLLERLTGADPNAPVFEETSETETDDDAETPSGEVQPQESAT